MDNNSIEATEKESQPLKVDEQEVEVGEPERKKMKPDFLKECFPISTLDNISEVIDNPPFWARRAVSLHKRSETVVQNTISDCHVELGNFGPKNRLDRRFTPKTLVCHDYKGGYLEDRHLSSTNTGNLYAFYNWAHIDIFVYFSHHLITIPPLCWINTAHRNGVKILGTLITEFDDGRNTCNKIFKDEDTMRIFATSLTQITKIFKFDGWLLNIENPVSNPELLQKFVAYLSLKIHEDNPENLVIWYDSVTDTGELKWQNELNINNKIYFDHCDGIFLNYVWNENNILKTVEMAKHRTLDVFVGVDVFGRNTYGGGEFNCYKAAQVIRRHHLSMAIFAPGWTHETLPGVIKGDPDSFENFINRDCAFWNSLWPYLYTHPIKNFFRTSFFKGVNQTTYNIFAQHQQLSKIIHPKNLESIVDYTMIPPLNNKCVCLQCSFGHKSVQCLITKEYINRSINYLHRLFICDIELSGTITLYYLTKISKENHGLISFHLLTMNSSGNFKIIKCNSLWKETLIDNSTVLEVNPSRDFSLLGYVNRNYEYLLKDDDLGIFAYQFTVPQCILLEIGAVLDTGTSVILSAFAIEKDIVI